jgi:hypothetical protein
MDADLYKAALWCGPCTIKMLVAERKSCPGAIEMPPAEALEQIISANGFAGENDYDSDDAGRVPMPTAAAKQTLRSILTAAGLVSIAARRSAGTEGVPRFLRRYCGVHLCQYAFFDFREF